MAVHRRDQAAGGVYSLALVLSVVFAANVSGQQPGTPSGPTPRHWAGRILGVFDETTGQPIEGVEVYDLHSGSSSVTTKTGTVSLFFVDTTGSIVRLRKLGYQAILLPIANSPSDTTPLTVTLGPAVQNLPAVVTTSHRPLMGPEDTVRKLEQRGFYERRLFTGAPMEAFVSGKVLERLFYLTDIQYLTGRKICTSNMYLDGIKVGGAVTVPSPLVRPGKLRVGPSQIPAALSGLNVNDVVGMEIYSHVAEFPEEYNQTAAVTDNCLTLIWTK